MKSLSDKRFILTDLLAQAIHEQKRCETLACEWGSIDSELNDACRFDVGALWGCQRTLETLQRGEDVLADVSTLIHFIATLNDDREKAES